MIEAVEKILEALRTVAETLPPGRRDIVKSHIAEAEKLIDEVPRDRKGKRPR